MCVLNVGKCMKRKYHKLRACGRWMVWVCALISISLLYNRGYVDVTNGKLGPVSIRVSRNALQFSHTQSVQGPVNPKLYPNPQIFCGFGSELDLPPPLWRAPQWDVIRVTQVGGPVVVRTFTMPMMYISVVLVVWSVWLVRGLRHRFMEGYCAKCGYSLDGLVDDVCPECGEKYA